MKKDISDVAVTAKPKKKIYQKWWFWVVVIVAGLGIVGSLGDDPDSNSTPKAGQDQAAPNTSAPQEPTTQAYSVELPSGNYTVGIDFPAGTYDIVAVSGGGNVSSDNAFSGGINAVMGTADKNKNGITSYEQEYKNIKLPEDTVLRVSGGVVINISSDDASTDELTPRNQTITESVELGNGNFLAGKDFDAGVYDITVVSGGGNVSSDNILSGGLNAVMGTADKNNNGIGLYEQAYKNIDLPDGTTITISGVTISLSPSK
ncbi:MAG: hypothetical protein VB078_00210 [Clostridiaceae bacterium]|nr:hypothetical protein [Clostridiaceae bacterium]